MNWKEFKDRGGSVAFLVILATIIVTTVYFTLFGEDYKVLAGWRKALTLAFFFASIGLGYIGDKAKAFTPEKESDWKGGYWGWVVGIVLFFLAAVITATA